jgi:hypothetical protein
MKNKIIIIKLEGGLGNQMFQYALGRNLSLIHQKSLKFDLSYLKIPNQSGRTFRLGGFAVEVEEATEPEIATYRSTLQKILDKFRSKSKRRKVLEQLNRFEPKVLEKVGGYFVGHWNDERYFKSSENAIRKDFELKKPFSPLAQKIAEEIAVEPEPVSVHIRRGDYVSIPKIANTHRTLPISYYKEACGKILEKKLNAHFFISSDDIGWTKENFPKEFKVSFVSSTEIPDYEELKLMSLCKHQIIANSTYSWWSAWLNQNPDKIVIAPKRWFVDPNRKIENLILPKWIQI